MYLFFFYKKKKETQSLHKKEKTIHTISLGIRTKTNAQVSNTYPKNLTRPNPLINKTNFFQSSFIQNIPPIKNKSWF